MRVIQWILEQIFPTRCAGCGIVAPDGICERCREQLPFVEEDACPKCGRGAAKCLCGKRYTTAEGNEVTFHFSPQYQQLVAPCYYTGAMRRGISLLKFHGQKRHALWMGREMARSLQKQMVLSQIDLVVPVPLSRSRLRERGYNQAALLAREVAGILELPFSEQVLIKTKENAVQHTLSHHQRLLNVEGVYAVQGELSGKCLLLIDDVSTSGATLSSCGQALYSAGAEAVVCCVAAVTVRREDE